MGVADAAIGAVQSGGSSLIKFQVKWRLYDIDHGTTIEGRFAPLGLTQDMGSVLGGTLPLNRQDEIVQWLSGAGESMSFDALVWADDVTVSILSQIQALQNLVKRDPTLRRAPICRFTYGSDISFMCIVESLGGIRYGEARIDGKLRSAMFTISLRKYVPYSPTAEDSVPTETYYRPTKQAETYELIAKREYGAGIKGVNLRGEFPSLEIVIPPGDIVPVLESNDSRIVAGAQPYSDIFKGLQRDRTVLDETIEARSAKYVSTVLGQA